MSSLRGPAVTNQPKPNPPKPNPKPQPNTFLISVKISVISSLAASAILAFVGWVFFYSTDYIGLLVDKKIDTKLQAAIEKSDGKLQTITDKLDTLGQRVAKIEGKLEAIKIQSLAMQPKKGVNGKQALEILNTAKKDGTRLDPKILTDAGKEFISAGISSSDPAVWQAALAFLDYRSFLNSALAPATDTFAPVDKEILPWKFVLPHGPMKPGDEFRFKLTSGKKIPAERAAVIEPIGSRLNADQKVGLEFVLVADYSTGFKLDGYRLKYIIFKDSKIIYEGGPVEMENVYFVNCTFEVSRRPNGQSFASTVLASAPATTFHAG
jgi:hypothetical protein